MISFPHAKINLGLSILSKRSDGFHNLKTIFYPVPKRDVIEITAARETRFIASGLPVPGHATSNLILRAFDLLKKNYPQVSSLEIRLYKSIPVGAGMGGGSSDAAHILRMVSRFFSLPLSAEELAGYALELGSDCPFFLQDAPCLASGRGEILKPVSLDLSGYSFLLIHPDTKIDTAWAYAQIKPALPAVDLEDILQQPVKNWPDMLYNDFEPPVFAAFPFLKTIKEQLYAAGAHYASMTGSGSTIFGIFPKDSLPDLKIDKAVSSRIC